MRLPDGRFVVVVGAGGVGKTTLAAALGLSYAGQGDDTLVMTFDPSLRLKDALGVGDAALDAEVEVAAEAPGALRASLLDARSTFDRLVTRHAPDAEARRRILDNRFYRRLAGHLAGILEYMAVERLFEVAGDERYRRVVLDTPPTREALDFLEAPQRIVDFLDSGALRIALRPWFDDSGHLRLASRLPGVGKRLEAFLDGVIGLGLLSEMAEFFQAFGPLYAGFRERAIQVQDLLRSERTVFVLVSGPGPESNPDAMFFARRLEQTGYRLAQVVVNRVHPRVQPVDEGPDGDVTAEGRAMRLLHWLGERDHRGLAELRSLLPGHPVHAVPLLPEAPTGLASLRALGERLVTAAPRP